jgi:hypothetical protein
MKKLLLLFLMLGALIGLQAQGLPVANNFTLEKAFPDKMLRARVAQALGDETAVRLIIPEGYDTYNPDLVECYWVIEEKFKGKANLKGQKLSDALAEIEELNASGISRDESIAPRPKITPITDASGLEYLTGLKILRLADNLIETLDVSRLTNLTHIDVEYNYRMKTLDISKLTNLESIWMATSGIEELDVRNLRNMKGIVIREEVRLLVNDANRGLQIMVSRMP